MEVKYSGYYGNIVLADFINLWLVMARGFLGMALFFLRYLISSSFFRWKEFGTKVWIWVGFSYFLKNKRDDMFLCRICNSN